MLNIKSFIFDNHEKGITFGAYIYSAYYRLLIKLVPMKKIEKRMGIRGQESLWEESPENMRIARLIAFHVNRVTDHTPWESKCFVRALAAQKLLHNRRIESTIYMGVKFENNEMKAHAWLRCGNLYLTGGSGQEFSMVAKFKK